MGALAIANEKNLLLGRSLAGSFRIARELSFFSFPP